MTMKCIRKLTTDQRPRESWDNHVQLAAVMSRFPMAAICLGATTLLICQTALATGEHDASPLQLKQTFPLPGVKGRIDHLDVDLVGERLFVCALGNNSLEVIDLRKGKRVHSITGLNVPQGVAYVPDGDRIFVANDDGGICRVYDGKSFKQLAEINLHDDADNVRYDAAANKIYIGFGTGGLAVLSASDGKQMGAIKLSAHPESFQLETNGKRAFVNVPNARHVAVVDREQAHVVAKWNLGFAFANFPMALDETNQRLLVGCRMPSKLVVLDSGSGKVVSQIDISGDADDVFYDSKRRRIYVVCGAGKVDIIEQKDANTYRPAAKVSTAAGARTGLFVPQLDTLFVAVPQRGSQAAEIRAYRVE